MPTDAVIQTHIDSAIKVRAEDVLKRLGLTVSDVVRLLLTRTADEGALPFSIPSSSPKYDAWFEGKVQEAMDDARPAQAHEFVKEQAHKRHSAALVGVGE